MATTYLYKWTVSNRINDNLDRAVQTRGIEFLPDVIRINTLNGCSDVAEDIALHQHLGTHARVDGSIHAARSQCCSLASRKSEMAYFKKYEL